MTKSSNVLAHEQLVKFMRQQIRVMAFFSKVSLQDRVKALRAIQADVEAHLEQLGAEDIEKEWGNPYHPDQSGWGVDDLRDLGRAADEEESGESASWHL